MPEPVGQPERARGWTSSAMRWRATRHGNYLIGLGAVAALAALVIVLSLVVVTDRKRLVWTVEEVARQISGKNFDAAFSHFAEEVRPASSISRVTYSK